MSDGLPELFNPGGAMFGYERARTVFEATARAAPEAIIDHLVETGRAWTEGHPPGGDVTFVVLRRSAAP